MIRDQLAGSILGQALGDALGFVVEAEAPDVATTYVEQWLRAGRAGQRSHRHYPFGQYSDDTQLARELLLSFEERRGWDPAAFAVRLSRLFHDRLDVGAGKGTRSAALRLLMGVPWSESGTAAPYAGNGSAMRAGPLGLLFKDLSAVTRAARQQSRVTHLDPRCAAGAAVVASAVWHASKREPLNRDLLLTELAACAELDDRSVADAIRGLAEWVTLSPGDAANEVHARGLDPAHPEWRGISAFITPSLLWSLYAFLRSPDDYWETICTAIWVGGDTDTMAAIAGAISGARVGVSGLPADLMALLTDQGQWGAPELTRLAHSCADLVERR